jgi:hypothetical protein
MSKPFQVYLDERDLVRLERWSKARGWTKSQSVRAAVRALTRPAADDPVLELSGFIVDDLPADVSANFHRYLMETYHVAEKKPRYDRRRPASRLRR